eukprot:TRINITY_DN30916_c0_g1_i2.p1 TRINITY_DN30916_c0_g1~~TRINITY_DN30916_c0_g1_i2.p1  ORF type:complete len:294 (+),score=62.33 TRINITY_DN30916_c0_g1_i2:80-961(+)
MEELASGGASPAAPASRSSQGGSRRSGPAPPHFPVQRPASRCSSQLGPRPGSPTPGSGPLSSPPVTHRGSMGPSPSAPSGSALAARPLSRRGSAASSGASRQPPDTASRRSQQSAAPDAASRRSLGSAAGSSRAQSQPAGDAGSARGSLRSASGCSVTTSEALRKLGQLEQLLESERRARRAAEETCRQLLQRERKTVKDTGPQAKLDVVLSSLRSILGEGVPVERLQHVRRDQRPLRPAALPGRSIIDRLGEEEAEAQPGKRQPTAARCGVTVDYGGKFHFKPVKAPAGAAS